MPNKTLPTIRLPKHRCLPIERSGNRVFVADQPLVAGELVGVLLFSSFLVPIPIGASVVVQVLHVEVCSTYRYLLVSRIQVTMTALHAHPFVCPPLHRCPRGQVYVIPPAPTSIGPMFRRGNYHTQQRKVGVTAASYRYTYCTPLPERENI